MHRAGQSMEFGCRKLLFLPLLLSYYIACVAGVGVEEEKWKEMSETNIEVGNKNG
jgi:hypothetical protein